MGKKGPQQVGSHEHPDFQWDADKPCSPQQPFQKPPPNCLEAAGWNLRTPGGSQLNFKSVSCCIGQFIQT